MYSVMLNTKTALLWISDRRQWIFNVRELKYSRSINNLAIEAYFTL